MRNNTYPPISYHEQYWINIFPEKHCEKHALILLQNQRFPEFVAVIRNDIFYGKNLCCFLLGNVWILEFNVPRDILIERKSLQSLYHLNWGIKRQRNMSCVCIQGYQSSYELYVRKLRSFGLIPGFCGFSASPPVKSNIKFGKYANLWMRESVVARDRKGQVPS